MRHGDRITEVYCFIALDETDDCEGIPAFTGPHPDGIHDHEIFMPMVGADRERMMALLPMAREMVKSSGKKMRLVRFTQIEELGPVTP